MNVYLYIAQLSPDAANSLCKEYGYYDISNQAELSYCLRKIVADEGEPALKKIMELHPDKDVILELFEKKSEAVVMPAEPIRERSRDCSCMMNADGASNVMAQQNQNAASQTNMMILAAALIVSISIIAMNKNK